MLDGLRHAKGHLGVTTQEMATMGPDNEDIIGDEDPPARLQGRKRTCPRGAASAVSLLALLVLLALYALRGATEEPSLLTTTCGEVRGTLATNGIMSFKGVPFADKPKRWTPPEPCVPWQGVRDGTAFGASCVASDGSGDEDCLFVNVFVHKDAVGDEKAELPVMVFIYGGIYEFGSSSLYDATETMGLLEKSAVIVTLNHRTNIHGFLASDMLRGLDKQSGSTGVYGLQDQRMAFQWVKDNAIHFGGDPSNVMIFGESSGSGSISFHLVAPKSFGLYQRAGMQSSAFFTDVGEPMKRREAIFSQVMQLGKCTDVACLQAKTTAELTTIVQSLPQLPPTGLNGRAWVNWSPAIDGVEIKEHPYTTLVTNTNAVNKVPILHGTCLDEGAFGGGPPFKKNGTLDELIEFWTPFYEPLIGKQGITDMVTAYIDDETHPPNVPGNPNKQWWAALRANTDQVFACTDLQFSKRAGSLMPVFHYEFRPSSMPLVPHTAELPFLFRGISAFGPRTLTADEDVLSKQMIHMWAHFAKTGHPMHQDDWPRFDPAKDGPYMQIDVPSGGGHKLAYGFRKKACDNGPMMKWIEAVLKGA